MSYRERFKSFEELRAVDDAKRLKDKERGVPRPKRVITTKLWDYYYKFSGIELLNKQTKNEALDYLDSLDCEKLKALEYRLRKMLIVDNYNYRSFATLLGQKHDMYANSKKFRVSNEGA